MNSRLRISNQLELAEQAQFYVARAAQLGTRAVLILNRPPDGWLETFAQLCQCNFVSASSSIDRADRISALLGSERLISVIQLDQKPDLGLLAATAGAVKAGGLLVIGTGVSTNTSHARDETSGSEMEPHLNHSNQRLERLAAISAKEHPDTMCYVEVTSNTDQKVSSKNEEVMSTLTAGLLCSESSLPNPRALAEQNALLIDACNHLNSRTSSCIVIKGRRGRGKSSLLARLAAHLDEVGMDYRITAMHESALSIYHQQTQQSTSRYVSPESATKEPVNILLVDEAASISLTQLQVYLNHFRHVILCTTIDGYEASGRALDVRLLSNWSHKSMGLLQLDVKHPWRWADDDPLEKFIDQLLLNKTRQQPDPVILQAPDNAWTLAESCHLMQISQNELFGNETLLASVHALLHTTHYQTTSKDLEHLLDAPTVQLWIQMLDSNVVGVLVLEQEGFIDDNLHEAILTKKRRLPNQLLPQLLAQTANTTVALKKRFLRIIRLAVTSTLRRQKLASQLLQAVTLEHTATHAERIDASKNNTVDAIGASFAADECSLEFWQSHGYIEFHRGFRSNPRTGKRAVAMMKGFDKTTSDVLLTAARIHHDNELARQSFTTQLKNQIASPNLSVSDVRLLQRFADGQRSKHDTYASLQRLSKLTNLPMNMQTTLSARQHELELRGHVQHWINAQ